MNRILTYGTFDLLHIGHIRLLKRIKAMGNMLYVGVSSDEFNEIKGKKSFFSYSERTEILSACQYVDVVFPEKNWEQKANDIRKYGIDLFVMGDDWTGKFDYLEKETGVKIAYLPRTKNISTTLLREKFSKINSADIDALHNQMQDVLEVLQAIKQMDN